MILALTVATATCTPTTGTSSASVLANCQEGPVFFRAPVLAFEACGLTEYKPGEFATALPG